MDDFIGIIKLFAGNFAPAGWLLCQGQILSIQTHQALFTIIGANYGGDGTTTFALPNLQSCIPIGAGQGPAGLSNYPLGQKAGKEYITLMESQMPAHIHQASGLGFKATVTVNAGSDGATNNPKGNYWGTPSSIANNTVKSYTPNKTVMMAPDAVTVQVNGNTGVAGGSLPIDIRQPYLALNYIICIEGIFPSKT